MSTFLLQIQVQIIGCVDQLEMEQVQNGRLYTNGIGESNMKNKADKCENLTNYLPLLFYC